MNVAPVPGQPNWIAVRLGREDRFLTLAEAEQLRELLDQAIEQVKRKQEAPDAA